MDNLLRRRRRSAGSSRAERMQHQDERGSSIVELALVLPLLLTITFGLTDLGLAVYYYNTVANAAREGARYAIVQVDSSTGSVNLGGTCNGTGTYTASGCGSNTVVGRAANMASVLDLTKMPVTITAPTLYYGNQVTVSVSYPFRPVMAAFVPTPPITMTASSTMLFN